MMLAPEFSRAQTARISDFASSHSERGVFWMKPRKTGSRQEGYDELEGFVVWIFIKSDNGGSISGCQIIQKNPIDLEPAFP
jgi:hypothetical protein